MEKLREMLTRHEGKKNTPYEDTNGQLHIGIGRNLASMGISDEECMVLLDNDLVRCMKECASAFPFFSTLDQTRQDVVVMLCFSMGLTRLRGFKLMLAALESGDTDTAAKEMVDSRWATQVGQNRSSELYSMMATGNYPDE